MKLKIFLITLLTGILARATADAEIRLPAIFGTNMVLQRNVKVPVWGKADPGEQITITFQQQSFKAKANTDGKWLLHLASYPAGGPYQMTVKGKSQEIVYQHIWIGDVWVTSGQSNMEFGIQTEQHANEAIKNATDSLIHFFYVPMSFSLQPQDDIMQQPLSSPNGKWVVCSPDLLKNPKWAWHGFSAIGYYFAQQIRQSQHCPVGMIATYKGGTPAQAWVSQDGLSRAPAFSKYTDTHETLVKNLDEAKASYPASMAAYQAALKQWNAEVGDDFNLKKKQWDSLVLVAKAQHTTPPPAPKPLRPQPPQPPAPEGGFSAPSNLFNAMVVPIIPFGIKGIIWYQGESNGDRLADAVEYRDLFPRLIEDWRAKWGQNQLPFLFVQLTSYHALAQTPSEGYWPWVREAQLKTLSLPMTGMAVITDIGEAENIHPLNKLDAGLRLSKVARKVVYGENIMDSGPVYKSMHIQGNLIQLDFSETGSGLVADTARHPGSKVLKGFGIAGKDGKFVWADAVIKGNSVIVSSPVVQEPEAVRYNWADNPPGNLYNKEGFPASPFRTDNWAPEPAVSSHL